MNHAIIPAAGRSSRLGRGKALLPLAGVAVLDRLMQALTAGGVDRTVVVHAEGDEALSAHLEARGIPAAVNPAPERGMLSSILHGLEALGADVAPDDVLVICPVDYPAIEGATIRRLIDGLTQGAERVAVPCQGGRRGHPLALCGSLASALALLDLERGLRQLLDRHHALRVEVADEGIHRDLDTWADHAALERRIEARGPG